MVEIRRLVPARLALPREPVFWIKALLLALIGWQFARVLWALATPVGPVGQWMPPVAPALPAAAQTALLTSFDPFNSGVPAAEVGGPAAPVDGEYRLFGTRAAGGGLPGSAILAGPDGEQLSVAVGEAVAAGVRLVAVGFDQAVLERGGQRLTLTMEGATPAPAAAVQAGAPSPAGALSAARLRESIALAPRQVGGRVTGLLVSPVGDESVMQAAGLRSGDVIVAVGGRRIASTADVAMLRSQVAPGARLSLTVERGAATVPVAIILAGS